MVDMAAGMTLGARYELHAQLGEGGFGSVWRGRDNRLRRGVAVKLLHVTNADIPRFQREAQSLAQLNHPNIVMAYDYGVDDNRAYLVMELVVGRSLGDELGILRASGRPGLSVERVLDIADQVLDGLGAAHAAGFVHRDLKPQNIMTVDDGARVKLVDFGIAQSQDRTRLTAAGSIIGSLPYVSPEQLDGQPLDGRSDLYSLGCTLHELLTGDSPFGATTPASWIQAHHVESPAHVRDSLPDVPEPVDAFLQHLLAKTPADRPANAAAARALIAAIRRGDPLPPIPAPRLTIARPIDPAAVSAALANPAGPPAVGRPAVHLAGPPAAGPPPGPGFPGGPPSPTTRSEAEWEPTRLRPAPPANPPPGRRRVAAVLLALAIVAVIGGAAWGTSLLLAGRKTGGARSPRTPTVSTATRTSSVNTPPPSPTNAGTTAAGTTAAGTVTPAASGTDRHPCVPAVRPAKQARLAFRCPLIWDAPKAAGLTRIPVFATYDVAGLTAADAVDHLHRGQPQYFVCQVPGARFDLGAGYGFPASHHIWWALTQGDDANRFGFVPETYLWGGADDQPDPGLARTCTADDLRMAG
jgi:serine/threonine-protein kinase